MLISTFEKSGVTILLLVIDFNVQNFSNFPSMNLPEKGGGHKKLHICIFYCVLFNFAKANHITVDML